MRDDTAKWAFLVAHKCLAEVHRVLEAGQKNLPECDPAHRAMLRHAVPSELRWRISSVEREQHFHLLGDEADAARGPAASARERLEQRCRQAFVQREAAGRIDMHAIALYAVGAGAIAFIDGSADPGFFQALRQGEATDSAANDDEVEWRRYRFADGAASWMRGHRITPATCSSATKAPIATINRPRPTGEPQPYQLIAFCAYFQVSASFLISLVIASLRSNKRILPVARAARLFSRRFGWEVWFADLKSQRAPRVWSWVQGPGDVRALPGLPFTRSSGRLHPRGAIGPVAPRDV